MKKLKFLSKILFNVLCINFAFTIVASVLAKEQEGLITNQMFGGYKTEIISTEGEDDIYYKTNYSNLSNVMDASKNMTIAATSEGTVLLKNDNTLPLEKESKISFFGLFSANPLYNNEGSGAASISVPEKNKVSFKESFETAGFSINNNLFNYYKSKLGDNDRKWTAAKDISWDKLDTQAKTDSNYGDAAIYIITRWGYEGSTLKDSFLTLSSDEISVLKNLKAEKDKGTFKKIIVLFNSCYQIEMPFINDESYGIDAALWIGEMGPSGLYAVADIMSGEVCPSGHLTDLWYMKNSDNPANVNYGDFKNDNGSRGYVVYQEGLYGGYAYGETRYTDYVLDRKNAGDYIYSEHVAYPFGYGLSYTNFEYSNFDVVKDTKKDIYNVSVDVKNIGSEYSGKEVVQIYLQTPYTQYDIDNHIEKVSAKLVGFEKTSKLAPGEKETLKIQVRGDSFTSYDAYGIGSYILEGGKYLLTAATDSHNAANNFLSYQNINKTNNNKIDENGKQNLVKVFDLIEDKITYTTSVTGYKVTNLFDHADPNRLNDGVNTVNYLSRNDWNGTLATQFTVIADSDKIKEGYEFDKNKNLKKDETDTAYPTYGKPCGKEIVNENGSISKDYKPLIAMKNDDDGKKIAYNDKKWDEFLDQLSWKDTVTLLSCGFRQTRAIDSISKPATIDHNGSLGFVKSYANGKTGLAYKTNDPLKNDICMAYPSADIIAATFNKKLAYAIGMSKGEDSLWSGQAGIYGFGFNLHRTSKHGRKSEYYSEDAYLTGMIGGYESRGANSKGCYVYNKHFVLNEQEANRIMNAGESSNEVWLNEQTMREKYLEPWAVALNVVEDRDMNVMTSFNRIGSIWSGADKNLMTEWLRNEQGMNGFAVSDWTQPFMGYCNGVLAGNDLPDGNIDQFNDKEEGYAELAWAMRESAHRVCYTVVHSNAMNGFNVDSRVKSITPEWIGIFEIIKITNYVLFGLSTAFVVTMFVLDELNKRKIK